MKNAFSRALGHVLNVWDRDVSRLLLKRIGILGILAIISLSAACTGSIAHPPAGSTVPSPASPGAATASPKPAGASNSVRTFQSNTNAQDGTNCQQSSSQSTVTSTSGDGADQSTESSQSNTNSQVTGSCVNKDCSQINVQGNAAVVTGSNSSTTSNGANHSSVQKSITSTQGC